MKVCGTIPIRQKLLAGTVAALVLAPGLIGANLVVNGGFETGDFSGWTRSGDASASFVFAGSTLAHSGNYRASLGPINGLGYFEQMLPTVPGAQYELTFWLRNNDTFSENEFGVEVGGTPVAALHLVNSAPFGYTQFTQPFTAAAATTSVKFAFYNHLSYWYFDDVAVNQVAVPEPGAFALSTAFLLGATGLVIRRRRAGR